MIGSYMKSAVRVTLEPAPEQLKRLQALQNAFAQVCNALSPVVQQTRCWNRVALHHMAYKGLRERFPAVGSQMVCNAIYSVCRASRAVYQSASSPFNVARLGARPLPVLRFSDRSPVYFDRHTLSLKDGLLSLYTLDGRMRFHLALAPEVEEAFRLQKLKEVVLTRPADAVFELCFFFGDGADAASDEAREAPAEFPDYVQVEAAA
jgi:hypothetical protein